MQPQPHFQLPARTNSSNKVKNNCTQTRLLEDTQLLSKDNYISEDTVRLLQAIIYYIAYCLVRNVVSNSDQRRVEKSAFCRKHVQKPWHYIPLNCKTYINMCLFTCILHASRSSNMQKLIQKMISNGPEHTMQSDYKSRKAAACTCYLLKTYSIQHIVNSKIKLRTGYEQQMSCQKETCRMACMTWNILLKHKFLNTMESKPVTASQTRQALQQDAFHDLHRLLLPSEQRVNY